MPEDYKPCPLFTPLEKDKPAALMYWVYDKNGKAKKYTDASAEETQAFLLSLTGADESEEKKTHPLGLLPIKSVAIDVILTQQVILHGGLFYSAAMQKDDFFRIGMKYKKKEDK